MASPPEQPWTNREKNCLLAEIIKNANPHHGVLLDVIRSQHIPAPLEDIPLPRGRSYTSSRIAFNDMLQRPMSVPLSVAPATPTPLSAPTLKRTYPLEGSFGSATSGREIRPKPSSMPSTYAQPPPAEPPTKRKRGRPTKAEAQAKADAAAAAAGAGGESSSAAAGAASAAAVAARYSAPAQTLMTAQASTPLPPAPTFGAPPPLIPGETKPAMPPTTRMPISGLLTPSAPQREPQQGSSSSSSSGKRRRARSTKSDPEEAITASASAPGQSYDSPSGRSGGGTTEAAEDTPARTAVMRHRDDLPSAPRPDTASGPEEEFSSRQSDPPR